MHQLPLLLTIDEVAELFRVHTVTVKRWLADTRQGKADFPLPVPTPGNRLLRWRRDDILNYLAGTSQAEEPDRSVAKRGKKSIKNMPDNS